ncbi:MAG: Rrf2 family transcriptional regulator [Bacteroidota bacterium]
MLSNTCKYAIRAVIYLALFSSRDKKVGIKEMAEELDIPSPFLGKILQQLTRHHILGSTKGPHGGFYLNKPAIDISLMEIIELIDGDDIFNICVIRTSKCSHTNPCSLHDKISHLRNEERMLYSTQSIADLVSEFREGKERIRI